MPQKRFLIPDHIRNAANDDLAAETARRSVIRERYEKEVRCTDAVRAFNDATTALWSAQPNKALPFMNAVQQTLVDACRALADAGRLETWKQIDHAATFDGFRNVSLRLMSWPSYEWAQTLLDQACAGQLPRALLKQTWGTESLRDAIRWLRIFIVGLSGEGAVLPRMRERAPTAPTAPQEPNGAPLESAPVLKMGAMGLEATSQSLPRLAFDVETFTITLDGKDHRIADPKKFQIYKTIAEAGRQVTNAEIQEKVLGVRGKKAIPSRLQALPRALQVTIKTNTTGHWLVLPPIKKKIKTSR